MTKPMPDDVYAQSWIARVLANADRNANGCLIWRGSVSANGYGHTGYRGKTIRVHRQLFQLLNGTVARDIDVCHTCDVRRCIEISHLWAGTRKQNLIDCLEKGRHYRNTLEACKHGHPFTPENTEIRSSGPRPKAGRACKTCGRIRQRIKAGWTEEEARNTPVTPPNAKTARRRFGKLRASTSEEGSR